MKWGVVNIDEVLWFQEGPGVRNTQFQDTGIKLLNVGNINNNTLDLSTTNIFISEHEGYNKYKHFLIDDGDLLMASSGITLDSFHKKIAFASEEHLPLCMNTSTIRFKTKDENKCSLRYFSYYLRTDYFNKQLRKLITGSAQLNFGSSHLKQMVLPLPPLDIQEQIANTLDKADALIRRDQKLLTKYDELAQAIFYDMFGDPKHNDKKWDIFPLGDYINYIGDIGSNGANAVVSKNLKMTDIEDYALMIRTTNLNNNDFTKNVRYVSKETYDFFSKSKIYGGEIIMNKIGSAGDFWIMPNLNRPVSLGLNQFVIRLKDLNSNYLYSYLSTKYCKSIIKSSLNGAVTKSITKSAVKELPLIYPPLSLQNKYDSILKMIESQKSKLDTSLSKDLFSNLLNKYFS